LPRGASLADIFSRQRGSSARRRLVTSDSHSGHPQHRTDWHHLFAQAVCYLLAPLILMLSGFFTANFLISGQYTWPRTSRVLALTLTLLVLSYEFVYKEQHARTGSPDQARVALLYACVIPYVVGAAVMFALWKL
jgi:ABC-type multidrug transport system permease subunit